ncbi:hypothetical protein KC356_g1465 [Hortaea werneckii]|nr:hypothetical protein KC356_g1465 [Hortaea werneckii]
MPTRSTRLFGGDKLLAGRVQLPTKNPDISSTCCIPAHTISLPNSYTVVRDETAVGSEVTAFTPGPWIDANGKLKDLPDVGFGVGRRIFAGRHIARSGLFIKVARLLWAFEIVPGVDRITGGTIKVSNMNCVDGLVMLPKRLKAVFRPRCDTVKDVINSYETMGIDEDVQIPNETF